MKHKPLFLNVRIDEESLAFIREESKKRGMSQSDFVRAMCRYEKPTYQEFQACLKCLVWLQDQSFVSLEELPLMITYVENVLKRYSALPILKQKDIDIDLN